MISRSTPLQGQIFRTLPYSATIRGPTFSTQSISCHSFTSRLSPLRSRSINRGINTDASPKTSSVLYHTDIKISDRLKDRTCVITGGSSGIGYAIAERFLHEEASKVVIIGRNKKRLLAAMEKLHSSLGSASGQGAHANMGESAKSIEDGGGNQAVNQEPSQDPCETIEFSPRISALAGDVGLSKFWTSAPWKTALSGIDILVNAAGVSYSSRLMRAEDDHIESMLKTNLQGAIYATREMARRVPRQQNSASYSKSIINISSLLAFKGTAGTAAYASTKAGLIGLTRAVAVESSRPVKGTRMRANAIVPGYIETKILDEMGEAGKSKALEAIPLDRFGTPEEVADAAVFLASNEYANNCILNIDGGLSAV